MTPPAWLIDLPARFRSRFSNSTGTVTAVAPGRVNLIGEHTDYNDGWVLPMAIDRCVGVVAAPRSDGVLRACSVAFGETREVELRTLAPPGGAEWMSYVAGVAWAMNDAGLEIGGADLMVDGDVPLASGLSSSAAIEMAVARALCATSGIPWLPVEMALLGQRVEGEFVGVRGGVMDQFTATMGEEGHALLLDCRSLASEPVRLPDDVAILVMDTGAPRTLAGSAYNDRSRSCRRATAAVRTVEPAVRALRDVDRALLERSRHLMDEVTYSRALHVVQENRRPAELADALTRGALDVAGRLMDDSHASLRDLYEVSSPELDLFTEVARSHPACHGARLTGAGFGGCAIALVDADTTEDLVEEIHAEYRSKIDLPSSVFACRAASGARLLDF
jgi:galactokinase